MHKTLPDMYSEAILAAFPDPVFILTRSGRYAAVYGGTDRRYYHDGESLVGKNMHEVLKAEKADWFLGEIAKALESDGMHIVEYALAGSDVLGIDVQEGPENIIWFEGRVQALNFSVDGEEAVFWVASSITHRIEIEMQLAEALRREREAVDAVWQRIVKSQPEKTPMRWTLDVTHAQLKPLNGEPIALTANETLLLASLAEADGAVVPKDVLFSRMFPGTDSADYDRIDVTLSRLRRKLKRNHCGLALRSVFGKGLALTENLQVNHIGTPPGQ